MSDNPFGSCHKCASYANGRGTESCLKCKQYKLFNETWEDRDTIRVIHIPSAILEEVGDSKNGGNNVINAIRKLEPKDQACIFLQHFGECTVDEIADVLGVSDTAIDKRLRKARTLLKKILTNDSTIIE